MVEKTKKTVVLRFREFYENALSEDVAFSIFQTIADKGYPNLPVLSASQSDGMVERQATERNIQYKKENTIGYKRICSGQFAIHLRSFQGGFAHSNVEGIRSPAYTILGFKEVKKHSDLYWKYLFTSKRFIWDLRQVTYGIRDGRSISTEEFLKLNYTFPSLPEQEKIGELFSELDQLIRAKEEELEKLRQMKAALLEAMFPSGKDETNVNSGGGGNLIKSVSGLPCGADLELTEGGRLRPRLRFRGFTDDWQEKRLGEYFIISNKSNTGLDYGREDVLSVSDELGVVNQIEHLGRSFAGVSLHNYGVLEHGELVYTKSPLRAKPYGVVKENHGKSGIVSVLYAIYRAKEGVSTTYFHYYFDPDWRLNAYLRPIVNIGAKNTMNVSDETALEGWVFAPSTLAEQEQIGAFFLVQDEGIAGVEAQLTKLKTMKSALLDRMFA